MKLCIGVMGAAGGDLDPAVIELTRELGRAIARRGCVLVTGGAPGYPYAAVEGARDEGGLVIAVSPGSNIREHTDRYQSPADGFDLIMFTGDGLMGREMELVLSSQIVLIVGGRYGTLGEFAIAFEEGRLIGVLEGTGGVADLVPAITAALDKPTGAHILYDRDPARLVETAIAYYLEVHQHQPPRTTRPATD